MMKKKKKKKKKKKGMDLGAIEGVDEMKNTVSLFVFIK